MCLAKRDKQLIFFAPNVHTGGGFSLLKTLESKLIEIDAILLLDERMRPYLCSELIKKHIFFSDYLWTAES